MEFDSELSDEELREQGTGIDCAAPISLRGSVENLAGTVTLTCAVRARILLVCDRCLGEFEKDISVDTVHTVVRSESELIGDDDVICEDGALDLTELAVSDLLISLPTKILCREDCKGLCPRCGKNLNDGDCGCMDND